MAFVVCSGVICAMRTPPIIDITHYKALAQIMQANQAKSRREPYAQLPAGFSTIYRAIPHNSKCRYSERGAAAAKPKAQIILDAAKVSAASGGNSEPKQGQRSQSGRGFCRRTTMRVPQPDIIEHFGNADAVPQLPERCLSRKAGIVRYCHKCVDRNISTLFYGVQGCLDYAKAQITG